MELHRLRHAKGPWLHVLHAGEGDAWDLMMKWQRSAPGHLVGRAVRGRKATTTGALFDEFAAALQFPYYFGENWDAFDECLADLDWLPAEAYGIFVLNGVHLLEKEPHDTLQLLLRTLDRIGQEWGKPKEGPRPHPPRAFHVVLQGTKPDEAALVKKLQAAQVAYDVLA
jgi:hypothetical protein